MTEPITKGTVFLSLSLSWLLVDAARRCTLLALAVMAGRWSIPSVAAADQG